VAWNPPKQDKDQVLILINITNKLCTNNMTVKRNRANFVAVEISKYYIH